MKAEQFWKEHEIFTHQWENRTTFVDFNEFVNHVIALRDAGATFDDEHTVVTDMIELSDGSMVIEVDFE